MFAIQFVGEIEAGLALGWCEFGLFGCAFEQQLGGGLIPCAGLAQHD